MASQTRSAGLGQSLTPGDAPWLSPTNIYTSNDLKSYSNISIYNISYWLQASTFGFTIPTGSTITGITVYIERRCNRASAIKDASMHIAKGGLRLTATNKAKATFWETIDTVTQYGDSTEMWGTTWTPAEINASGFGAAICAENIWYDPRAYAYVDHIYIIVYYTVPSTNTKINIGDVFKDVSEVKINIGDSWKTVTKIQINIGDVWKTIFG